MGRFFLFVLLLFVIVACRHSGDESTLVQVSGLPGHVSSATMDSVAQATKPYSVRALLASRYETLERFKTIVQLDYLRNGKFSDQAHPGNNAVRLRYRENGRELKAILESGIRQDDINEALNGGWKEKLGILVKAPFAIRHREDLNMVHKLARRRPVFFGEGDNAFFDLALASVRNISTADLAYQSERDSSEKGYLNTFNHITAQAFITAIMSVEVAEFVGKVHERQNMPELTTGIFTEEQLSNPDNNPVDNYVDMVNNQLGQQLGVMLKQRYNITSQTRWTASLLADCLNELQSFYSWSFGIGMVPFTEHDERLIQFAGKINIVAEGVPYHDI